MSPINPMRLSSAPDAPPRKPMPLPKVRSQWRNYPACSGPKAAARWVKPVKRPVARPAPGKPLAAADDPQWCPACGKLCVRRESRVRCLSCGLERYLTEASK